MNLSNNMTIKTLKRCAWPSDDLLMMQYHDEEWGVPVHEDRLHFEFMILDAFQAGLSWRTILHKRENFRKAFDLFHPETIARYNAKKIENLLKDAGIIRNRLKIESTVRNAKAFLEIQKECDSFDQYIWQFTGGKTLHNHWENFKELPAKTKESDTMSKDLKKRGFNFVGSTICYAYMQAAGMVNDHMVECFRYTQVKKAVKKLGG
jgi:DNA-3-methyladenine glycosylase I